MSLVILPVDPVTQDFAGWQKRFQSIRRRWPEYFHDLIPTPEMMSEFRSQGLAPPPPGYHPDDAIILESNRWQPLFDMLAKKLTLALHYRYLGQPLSPSGKLVAFLNPNGHYDPDFDASNMATFQIDDTLKHGSECLADQFTVHRHISPDGTTLGMRVKLHEAAIVYGYTTEHAEDPRIREISDRLDGPFCWE